MKKQTAQKIAATLLPGALFLGIAMPALALDVDLTVDSSVSTGTTTTGVTGEVRTNVQAKQQARISAAQAKANAKANVMIEKRVQSLNALSARLNNMKHVSPETKAMLSASVMANIDSLNALHTKIQNDTTTAELKADMAAITQNQRIFALVEPQLKIAAAADSANSVAKMITEVDVKLKERLTAAQTAGTDVSAMMTLEAEMMAKVANAQVQANAAAALVAGLKPDNSDKAVFEANKTAIQSAREKIQTANKDLKSAQDSMKRIVNGLKGKPVKAQVKTGTSATVQ